MPPEKHRIDFLILGQGLAGSLLAWTLMQRGLSVLVVDDGAVDAASRVAAGLVNPLTGPRLVKSPLAEQCLAAAIECYDSLEKVLGFPVLVRQPVLRLFRGTADLDFFDRRLFESGYEGYFGRRYAAGFSGYALADPFGSVVLPRAGYVRAAALLKGLAVWLREAGALVRARLEYPDLRLTSWGVSWRGILVKRVVFCEGHRGTRNPWFDWLPLQPAWGEIQTLVTSRRLPPYTLSAGKWLLPLDGGLCRAGATYYWDKERNPDGPDGSAGLTAFANSLFSGEPTLRRGDLQKGCRAGTPDKSPLVGVHPHHPELAVCNGFGSKGCLQIPFYAARLADRLAGRDAVPFLADVRRLAGARL